MLVDRVGPIRVQKIDGGVRAECDVNPQPDRHWRETFDVYEQIAGYFNSIRVSGSKIIAEFPGASVEDITAAVDKRIESANMRAKEVRGR